MALRPMSVKFLPFYMGISWKILHRSDNWLQLQKIFGTATETDEAQKKIAAHVRARDQLFGG